MKKLILATALLTLASNIYAEDYSEECTGAADEMIKYSEMHDTVLDKYLMEGGDMKDVFIRIGLIRKKIVYYADETIKACEGEMDDDKLNVLKEYMDEFQSNVDD